MPTDKAGDASFADKTRTFRGIVVFLILASTVVWWILASNDPPRFAACHDEIARVGQKATVKVCDAPGLPDLAWIGLAAVAFLLPDLARVRIGFVELETRVEKVESGIADLRVAVASSAKASIEEHKHYYYGGQPVRVEDLPEVAEELASKSTDALAAEIVEGSLSPTGEPADKPH